MKSILLLLACWIASVSAFQRAYPSSFTGRATSVCSREELTTELSCPPSRTNSRRSAMAMPPFLKKLGFQKPKKEEEAEKATKSVTVLETAETSLREEKGETSETSLKEKEEIDEKEKQTMLEQVKEAGLAGVISLALWEGGFWAVSLPVCIFGYREVTGHWPDFQNKEDLEKLGAEAFAFVNFARFAVPLRVGLALSTTPWIQENIVDKYMKDKDKNGEPNASSE